MPLSAETLIKALIVGFFFYLQGRFLLRRNGTDDERSRSLNLWLYSFALFIPYFLVDVAFAVVERGSLFGDFQEPLLTLGDRLILLMMMGQSVFLIGIAIFNALITEAGEFQASSAMKRHQ